MFCFVFVVAIPSFVLHALDEITSFIFAFFQLIVRMADGSLLLAKEEYIDYSYNLLTIKVKPLVEPEVVDLISGQDLVDGMKVISLGRSFFTSAFYASVGKLYEYPPSFGCSELLTTDCGIPEVISLFQ